MAVAVESDVGLFIDGEAVEAASDLHLETKGVLVSTSPKPVNPIGL
jgi:hypothetical protein